MGHGMLSKNLNALGSPWVVFGKGKELFSFRNRTSISTLELYPKLLEINKVPGRNNSLLPKGMIYIEAELMWDSTTPSERVPYPSASEIITADSKYGIPSIKQKYKEIVEYSKNRTWIYNGDRYDLVVTSTQIPIIKKNNLAIASKEVPEQIKLFFSKYKELLAPYCIPSFDSNVCKPKQ
jgi:hypothetical protein